jgi:hypothetical protein
LLPPLSAAQPLAPVIPDPIPEVGRITSSTKERLKEGGQPPCRAGDGGGPKPAPQQDNLSSDPVVGDLEIVVRRQDAHVVVCDAEAESLKCQGREERVEA